MDLFPGEIYWAFTASSGRPRPVLVVSRPGLNRGKYFLAIPFTSARLKARRELPNCVFFDAGSFGLPKTCVAQADAITQLRRSDLARPLDRLGVVAPAKMAQVIRAIGSAIDADCRPDARDYEVSAE